MTAFAMDKTKKGIIQKLSDLRRLARRMGNPISPRDTNKLLGVIGFNEKSDQVLLKTLKEIEQTKFQILLSMPIQLIDKNHPETVCSYDGIDKFKTFLKLLTWGHVSEGVKTRQISSKIRDGLEDYMKKSRSGKWKIQVQHELLNSKAFENLKYAYSVKVLLWFLEKVKVEKNVRRRGSQRWTVLDGGLSFTYEEAALRGVATWQFARALKELHGMGFIDFEKHGSGMMKDSSVYKLSERWKFWGTLEFSAIPFPQPKYRYGYGRKR